MKFYIGAFLYLTILVLSVYGLSVEELKIGPGGGMVIKGWVKNSLCIFGLFLIACVSCYPIFAALKNALEKAKK